VVARNPFVSQSLRDVGIPQHSIIEGSYGFSPERLTSAMGVEKPSRPPVFAFVGVGNFGKGFDVLLEAWKRARVDGTLLIAGNIDEEMWSLYGDILSRPEVRLLGFVHDVASVYAAADVFVFPSHAEGGPQVVYEAAACGLASIISPMGAGRMVRNGIEGLIINPLEVDDLVEALRRLADDGHLRRTLGAAAAKRAAAEFTWKDVGRHLYDQFNAIRLDGKLPPARRVVATGRN
jgi:glycosyltransferase involved in cell wall biosynthesis